MSIIARIAAEPEFKSLCDALLRLDISPLVQTYAGRGRDGGIDAEYVGEIDGRRGRWIFQYKHRHPSIEPNKARAQVRSKLMGSGGREGEFRRVRQHTPCGYILLTNIEATPAWAEQLRESWRNLHGDTPFLVWDRSALDAMIVGREYLARSRSGILEQACRAQVVRPAWDWLGRAEKTLQEQQEPLWPVVIHRTKRAVHRPSFTDPFEWVHSWELRLEDTSSWREHPLYLHASEVAFPHSFRAFLRLLSYVSALFDSASAVVRRLENDFRERSEWSLGVELPEEGALLALAYAVAENAWGIPRSLSRVSSDSVSVRGVQIYSGKSASGIGDTLDRMVVHHRKAGPPAALLQARAQALPLICSARNQLWYAAELGIDVPPAARSGSG